MSGVESLFSWYTLELVTLPVPLKVTYTSSKMGVHITALMFQGNRLSALSDVNPFEALTLSALHTYSEFPPRLCGLSTGNTKDELDHSGVPHS